MQLIYYFFRLQDLFGSRQRLQCYLKVQPLYKKKSAMNKKIPKILDMNITKNIKIQNLEKNWYVL